MASGSSQGWWGAEVDVYRNGQVVLNNVTVDDRGPELLEFEILPGDDITVERVKEGRISTDYVSYRILDVNQIEVGSGTGSIPIESLNIPLAVCPSCISPTDLQLVSVLILL